MVDNQDEKRPQGEASATAAENRSVPPTAPSASRPPRPPRVLSRPELEALRIRLQNKFH
jgi:hypothetical protein